MNKLKLMCLAFATMFTTVLLSCSDDDDNVNRFEDLPAAVQKAFSNKYPDTPVEDWHRNSGYYVLEFDIDRCSAEAWFNTNEWKMTERDSDFGSLPVEVTASFKNSEYADWRVDDVDVVERAGMPVIYVLEVEKGREELELHFSADGTLRKVTVDYDDDNYLPELPSEIADSLMKMYPGAVILDFDYERNAYEVEIRHENMDKEVFFGKDFKYLSTRYEVPVNGLPEVVLKSIETSYPGYEIDEAEFVSLSGGGSYYEIELEKGDKEITIKVLSSGEILK